MIFPKKYIKGLLALSASFLMFSCSSDNLEISNEVNTSNPKDGYALSLTVELPVMDTRAGADWEAYEDYIDMDNLRLLFFQAQGKNDSGENDPNVDPKPDEITLFKEYKGENLIFTPIDLSTETYHKKWHVNIPLDPEKDKKFIETIKENDFKIAVLANWNISDDEIEFKEGESINKLHHLVSDNYSDNNKSGSQKNSKKDTYSFLFDSEYGVNMGLNTDWVKSKMLESDWKYKITEDNAASWIRDHWDPTLTKNKKEGPYQYDTYSDLWFLWNFGGNENNNALKYYKKASEWEKRNGANLRNWITKNITNDEEEGELEDLNEVSEESSVDGDTNYLQFKTIEGAKGLKKPVEDGTYNYGILLPFSKPKNGNSGMKIDDPGVISFMARATGTLTIWARHGGGQYKNDSGDLSAAKIVVQRGISGETDNFNFTAEDEESAKIYSISKRINITGDEERLFIYNGSNNSSNDENKNKVEIYQIEYIQDKYLYDTDRKGVEPSESQGILIPMYGVQQFGALKDVWKDGTVFDLSNFDGQGQASSSYEYSDIYLLRSVAKVELLIPSSFQPHHVYMRSMNRSARNEPMDVITNTRDIWADGVIPSTENHKKDCEWTGLNSKMESGSINPFYNPEGTFDTYQRELKWYYGTWDKVEASGSDFPHILNPMINRSDFTEFIQTADEGNYNRFVLYVPEKFVDDPNAPGDPTEIPKVCHIEFRVDDDPFTNLDDNNCYRLYFTTGGVNADYVKNVTFNKPEGAQKYQTWETEYEQKIENLRTHWPIMRNHVYRFTVLPGNKQYMSAEVKVLSWKKLDVPIYW